MVLTRISRVNEKSITKINNLYDKVKSMNIKVKKTEVWDAVFSNIDDTQIINTFINKHNKKYKRARNNNFWKIQW